MNIARPVLLSAGVIAAMAAGSAWALARIGASTPIPVHFGLNGPDRWEPAGRGVWVMPGLALILAVVFAVLPRIMPANAKLERSQKAYGAIWVGVLIVLAVAHAAVLRAALGSGFDPSRMVFAAVGVLILVLGNVMGKIRYNYVMGVRTPWTLASERVWDRTHRAVGPWFMIWGASLLLAAFLAPAAVTAGLILVGALGVTAAAVAYSYREARREGVA